MLAIQPGDHIGTSFSSPAEFAAATIAFAEQGLRAAALVMVFPGEPHRRDTAGFRDYLATHSPALAAAAARGQLQVADSRRVQLAPRRFDPEHLHRAYEGATARARAAGYRGLWASVDMSWAADVDPAALAAFEAGAFPLFTSQDLTAICQYDRRVFPPAAASAACAAHPVAPDNPRPLRHRREGDTLFLSGETDLTNRAAFDALLESLHSQDTLDITAMTYIDVRGLAAIAERRLKIRAAPVHRELVEFIRG